MKRFYSVVASAIIGAFGFTASAQSQEDYEVIEDLTAAKIVNADFQADEPVTRLVRTYAKDLTDAGQGAGGEELYGQQPVTGWTAARPTDNIKNAPDSAVKGDACASAIFAYLNDEDPRDAKLGGDYYAPVLDMNPDFVVTGTQTLGMVAVWGTTVQYTQEVTLPAGAYMIVVPVVNTAGDGSFDCLNGFIADNGTKYLSAKTSFAVGQQVEDVIAFKLEEETTGKLSIGYTAWGGYGSGKAPHVYYDCVKLYSIDPAPLVQAEIAAAKENLLKVIEQGEQLGADVEEAVGVYDDDSATLEQVLAAIEAQKALNEATKTDLSEFFIMNPHFNVDSSIEDGICTYDYDMAGNEVTHYGMQPLTGWVASNPNNPVENPIIKDKNMDNEGDGRACGVFAIGSNAFLGGAGYLPPTKMSDGTEEGNILGFISVWGATSQYTQAVTLPAGKYTFSVSYYNAGGTGTIDKNLMGFITEDGDEYLCEEKTFKVGEWTTMQTFFELEEETAGSFTLGFKAGGAGSASMPHFFIDGINLNYVGEVKFDASLIALKGAVNTAQPLMDYDMQAELKEQFEAAVEAAQDLMLSQSSDKNVNKAAADAINTLLPVVKANIAAYEKLYAFAETVAEKMEEYAEIAEVAEALEALQTSVNDAIDEYSWDTETINSTIASLDEVIKGGIKAAWEAAIESGEELETALNITGLFDGLAYTYSTDAKKGADCPDKDWNYGNASSFSTQYGAAEVWNQSPFTVSRTLTDMPAGTYTITTRAFYRTAENTINYDNYQNGQKDAKAFVFAGHAKTGLTNVAELVAGTADYAGGTADVADGVVPNNREAAHNIFESEDYAEVVEKSVSTVLTEAGDLTFGITADQLESNSWVVWYSFQVAYNAVDNDVLAAEVEALIAEAEAMKDYQETVNDVYTIGVAQVEAATSELESAIATATEIEPAEAIKNLSEAINYAKESIAQLKALVPVYNTFVDLYEGAEFESQFDFQSTLEAANPEGEYIDNEQIKNWIELLPTRWVTFALANSAMATASKDEPVEVTPAIFNTDFEYNIQHWVFTADSEEEGAKIAQNQAHKTNEAFGPQGEIDRAMEAWNSTALNNGTVAQEILVALPKGYYMLTADVFAIKQGNEEEEVSGVYLMAENNTGLYTADICSNNANPNGIEVAKEVGLYSDGEDLTTVGLIVYNTNANWVVIDNIALYYLGDGDDNCPTGIDAQSAVAATQQYYTVGGMRQSRLQKGVNIIVTTNADGTRSVVKAIVK